MAGESEQPDEPAAEIEQEPEQEEAQMETEATPAEISALPIYIPPSRGAAKSRVGAATRGPRTDLGQLMALAPDHVGLSSDAQPRLYWYLERDSRTRIDVALIDDRNSEPLLEISLEPPVQRGFHVVDCREHGITLGTGRVYQWFVAFVPEPARRSHDVIASGAIEVVRATGDNDQTARSLAGAGLWYDAVAVLQRNYRADPNDSRTLAALSSLAEQVDLELTIAQ